MKRLLINLFLCLSIIIILVLVTEFILAKTIFSFNQYSVSPGPGIPFKVETIEYKTTMVVNSHDMRGPEVSFASPGEYEMLFLGDSFTYGLGVDLNQTYVSVIDKKLNDQGISTHTINAGGGFAAKHRVDFMKSTALNWNPDFTLIQIFIGNDFYDGLKYLGKKGEVSLGVASSQPWWRGLKDWAARESRIGKLIWHALLKFKLTSEFLYRYNFRQSNRGIYLREYPDLEKKVIEDHMQHLEELLRILKERGSESLVLIIPEKQQVIDSHLLDETLYDVSKPNNILRNWLNDRKIPYIDMLEVYSSMDLEKARKLYYVQDMHWTPEGHENAANIILEHLKAGQNGPFNQTSHI